MLTDSRTALDVHLWREVLRENSSRTGPYGSIFLGRLFALGLAAVECAEHAGFVLFGSHAAQGHGWDAGKGPPVVGVGTTGTTVDKFPGTGIRAANGQAVGAYRRLLWVVGPLTQNTAFQEFQILVKR